MGRPEKAAKTPVGQRLRAVRAAIGNPPREILARKFLLSKNAVAFYERGEREPNLAVLTAYHELYGVNINWVLTGQGDMFSALPPRSTFDGQHVVQEAETLERTLRNPLWEKYYTTPEVAFAYDKLQNQLSVNGLPIGLSPQNILSIGETRCQIMNSYTLNVFANLLIRDLQPTTAVTNIAA
ncbi:helix-turn-helix domain-containing protein [Bartonella sp. DGB2]|uniref:helix-turn-helix domain-containing protein n=1 Tax=Bartonella sp. DGB2 TaxID=3388426 RepID=UPI003990148B